MKLYYSPGSCSTSCHIVLEESGLRYEALEVDWDNASDPNVARMPQLNPLGTLPVMELEDGKVLTQNLSIQTHAADLAPEKKLLPRVGTVERAEAMNWLSFVASDLHKSFAPLFGIASMTPDKNAQAQVREWNVQNVKTNLAFLDRSLAGKDYLMGKDFTVADAYAFVVVGWTKWLQIPLTEYTNLNAYLARIYQRPAVQKVMKEEGLLE